MNNNYEGFVEILEKLETLLKEIIPNSSMTVQTMHDVLKNDIIISHFWNGVLRRISW